MSHLINRCLKCLVQFVIRSMFYDSILLKISVQRELSCRSCYFSPLLWKISHSTSLQNDWSKLITKHFQLRIYLVKEGITIYPLVLFSILYFTLVKCLIMLSSCNYLKLKSTVQYLWGLFWQYGTKLENNLTFFKLRNLTSDLRSYFIYLKVMQWIDLPSFYKLCLRW